MTLTMPGDATLVDCAVIGPKTILVWAAKDGAVIFGRVDLNEDDVSAARIARAMLDHLGQTLDEVGEIEL